MVNLVKRIHPAIELKRKTSFRCTMRKAMTSEGKAFVIFSGYNQRGIIAFCRFAASQNIPFYIISTGKEDSIHKTKYADRVIVNRSDKTLELNNIKQILTRFRQEEDLDELIILPSTEYLNRFLLNNKEAFEENNITIPLVDKSLYETISDKYRYNSICKDHGLAVPEEIDKSEPSFPLVAKPKQYFNGEGKVQSKPLFAYSQKDLEYHYNEHDLEGYYFQEFINGPSFYLLFYISADGDHAKFSQKNFVQQSNGGSMLAAASAQLHHQPICDKYIELFENLGFQGLVMVELKKRDGEYYMIEANPRLWGPSQLFVDAGVSIFERFVSELGFDIDASVNSAKNGSKYFWNGGLVEEYDAGRELTYYNGYGKEQFLLELPEWMSHEVYRKKDSHGIFMDQKNDGSKRPKLK